MRSIDSGVQTLLAALTSEHVITLLYIPSLSLRWTTWPRSVTWNSQTWVSPVYTDEASGFKVTGLSETIDDAIPVAELRLECLDGTQQARFWADSFRDELVYITGVLKSGLGGYGGIAYPETPWQMDADADGRGGVIVRLSVSKAQQQIPHRTTQESHCEHEYGPDARQRGVASLCPYRGPLLTCDFTLDGPNGCARHFPDIDENGLAWVEGTSTGERIVVPLPYGGSPSGMADRLVT